MLPSGKMMKTEAKRNFYCGFALTEGELRRIHDLMVQQFKKIAAADTFEFKYELKYRNGSVSYPSDLEEVLSQENFGSTAILRLGMAIFDDAKNSSNAISISFVNSDQEEESEDWSVRFRILGEDRDWVFVTSSQLEERISKVKLFTPNQVRYRKYRPLLVLAFSLVVIVLFSIVMFLPMGRQAETARAQLTQLDKEWRSGLIKDPAEVTLRVAAINSAAARPPGVIALLLPVELGALLLALPILAYFYAYFNPPYNFLWGDYVARFEKRKSVGRFVMGGVILAILLGVIANVISKHIGI